MKPPHSVKSLSTLVTLREKDVDRLSADVAAKQVVRVRYQTNLERMARLVDSCEPISLGNSSAVQALNRANYKTSVLQMADLHRQDLALHEADMAIAQNALHDAARRQEVLEQVLDKQQRSLLKVRLSQEQKQQDDMASQVWLRAKA